MLAKYNGRCSKTGKAILKGDTIRMENRKAILVSENRKVDKSDLFIIGGNEYIRNSRGRCIDAPCCGCCTI